MEQVPEELELRWLAMLPWTDLVRASLVCSHWQRIANDASLWEGAFVREFGDKEADAVRAATSVRQAMDNLWRANESTIAARDKYGSYHYRTQLYRPSRNDAEDRSSGIPHNYDKSWDSAEVQPYDEDNNNQGEEAVANEVRKQDRPWKAVFLRHYLLRYRWLHGCDPWQALSAGEEAPIVMRAVVAGMKSSGKSHFLRAMAPDQQVVEKGVNVVVVARDGYRVALLEIRRPNGTYALAWHHIDRQLTLFLLRLDVISHHQDWYRDDRKSVTGMIFMVDCTEFRPFLGGERGSDDEFQRMEAVYKRFHGVAGQAHNSRLIGVVCAHKIDRATSQEEKEELEEVISRKLRVNALKTCGWYSVSRVTTLSTSATDRQSCLAVVDELFANRLRTSFMDQP